MATCEEIKVHDFNLNISRYVDTFEEEAEIDLGKVQVEIAELENELACIQKKLNTQLFDLGLS